jgi:hypothetical protein
MLREGSCALAALGKIRKLHETIFPLAFPVVFPLVIAGVFGRKSVARKRMSPAALVSARFPDAATFAGFVGDF